MNCQALADDFDGQGTSFGLIQWNFGSNTLGPLLKKMLDKNETAFAKCFGEDADYDTLKTAINAGNKNDQLKWARNLLKTNRKAWQSAFNNIGSNDAFNKIQREEAAAKYHDLVVAAIDQIRGISPDLFQSVEVRSYVALFDLCVQQHGVDNVVPEIKKRVKDEKPTTQLELMKIVVVERGKKAKDKWVSDCISRRMGILNGSAYKSKEHGVTAERKNTQFGLLGDVGGKFVLGL